MLRSLWQEVAEVALHHNLQDVDHARRTSMTNSSAHVHIHPLCQSRLLKSPENVPAFLESVRQREKVLLVLVTGECCRQVSPNARLNGLMQSIQDLSLTTPLRVPCTPACA
jgi:hypothetical protein